MSKKSIILCLVMICVFNDTVTSQADNRIAEIEQQLRIYDDEIRTKPYTLVPVVAVLRDEAYDIGDPRIQIMSNLVLAKGYESQKDYDQAYKSVDTAFAIAEMTDYHEVDFMLHLRRGFISGQRGENEKSIPDYEACVALAREKGNEAAEAQALCKLGSAYTKLGELDEAIKRFDEARELSHRNEDDYGLQMLHTYMAIYYARNGERDKALEEELKSLELSTKRQDTAWMIISHLNLLSNYAVLGNVEKAFYHYHERNKIIELIEYPEDRKTDLNIGVLYVQSGRYEEALEVLNICRDYYTKEGNIYRVALIDHWQALAYRGLDQYDVAAEKSITAYETSVSIANMKLAELSAFTLFQTYHWRGRDSDAIEWLITSNEIKDSLITEENKQEMLALETKYETFRKEQEIEMLKAQSEIERTKKNQLWIGLIATLLLGGLVVYNLVMRRRKEKEIEVQKLRNAQLEQDKLLDRLHHKEKQLASQLLQMAQKNEFLAHITDSLTTIQTEADNENKFRLQKVIRTISHDIASNETWEQFLTSFKEIHSSFFEKLVSQYNLTANELRLASMMKMNMSGKEIAALLNISDDGVKKARYRLRKKLGLDSEVNIQNYLLGLG